MRKKLKILLKLPHLVLLSLSLYNFTLCCRFCCYFIFWQPVTFLLQHTFTKESSYGVVAIVLFFTKLFALTCHKVYYCLANNTALQLFSKFLSLL